MQPTQLRQTLSAFTNTLFNMQTSISKNEGLKAVK